MRISGRPHVCLNVAMSVDGKIDTVERRGATLSSSVDKIRVDALRAAADAVMVGGRTLVHEDPRLTVKSVARRAQRKARGLEENPVKVGVVSIANLRLGGDFLTAGPARRLIYTTRRTSPRQVKELEGAGAEVFILGEETVDLTGVLRSLRRLGIRELMVEGGGTLIAGLFRLGLVDEMYAYIAPLIFGGATAPTPADGPGFAFARAPRLRLETAEKFDSDGGVLLHYIISQKHKG